MNPTRKKRIYLIFFIILGVSVSIAFALVALKENINLFYSPTQIVNGEAPVGKNIRAGGMVKLGSVTRDKESLDIQFTVTDYEEDVIIKYNGILPDLFREGQGIVALGELNSNNILVANQVLAKHDETYMPPEVKQALKESANSNDVKTNSTSISYEGLDYDS